MLTDLTDLLRSAGAERRAVGAFTCYDTNQAAGVLDAAERRGVGTVLLVSPGSLFEHRGGALVAALSAMAREAAIEVCVQVDHVKELDHVRLALDAGAGAVMVDGSHLPQAANRAMTRAAVLLAQAAGAEVECELGGIAGDEDVAAAIAAGALTEPHEAAAFVRATGAACLAVSIGNVHGHYASPPRLDFDRLSAIRDTTAVPLSLHGASGLPEAQVGLALVGGITKVNVNTELRERYLSTVQEGIASWVPGARVQSLAAAVRAATADVVAVKLALLETVGDRGA